MKRITPEEVVAAYAKTGLRPTQGQWCDGADGDKPTCACGLGVLYLSAGGNPVGAYSDRIGHYLQLDARYVGGFTSGFDGDSELRSELPLTGRYREGYLDGRAAAAAVFTNQQES